MICYYILFIAVGYLSGSILWSKIIARLFYKCDIVKESPDKNPGASNVFRSCGVLGGLTALFFDLAKGFLLVYFFALFRKPEKFSFLSYNSSPRRRAYIPPI